jgi:tetratricopeptide (TPR) repeat protein
MWAGGNLYLPIAESADYPSPAEVTSKGPNYRLVADGFRVRIGALRARLRGPETLSNTILMEFDPPGTALPKLVDPRKLPPKQVKLHRRARKKFDERDFADAEALYEDMLVRLPGDVTAIKGLGNCLFEQGKHGEALDVYQHALKFEQDDHNVYLNLGNIATKLHMPDAAVEFFTIVTNLRPAEAAGYNNLASTLRGMGKYDDAISVLQTGVSLEPENPRLWNTLGITAQDAGHHDESLTFYQEALRLDPTFPEAQANIGLALVENGQFADAIEPLAQAIRLDPTDARSHFNYSIALGAVGRLPESWEEYEWRLDPALPTSSFYHHDMPLWGDEDITGKGLLICSEQGIGDEIQFASMFNETLPLAGHCLIECDQRLVSLYRRSFPAATPIPTDGYEKDGKRHRTYPFLQSDPPIAYAAPAGGLRRKFRPTPESFFGKIPYLVPDPGKQAVWKERFADLGPELKVGICWRSMRMTAERRKYYSELKDWAPIFNVPGVKFINLQYDDCADEIDIARDDFGADIHVWPGTDLKDDMETLAALMSELDLVITAGTMIHALAGALGLPTWLFGPHKHDGFKWFETLEIFSQAEAGGRAESFQCIANTLAEQAQGHNP